MPHMTQKLIIYHIAYEFKDKEVKLYLCSVKMEEKRCIENNIKGKDEKKKLY
jgi:hypothetical protein